MYPGTFADTTPDAAAIVVAESGAVTTYAELDDRSTRLANLLHAHGLRPGDHVAFVSDNRPTVFEVYWACLRSGLYVTGINFHLTPDEASYIARDCGATALIASATVGELAAAMVAQTPDVTLRLAFGGDVAGYESYEDTLAAASSERPAVQPTGADMLYSSGTTGRPKGVLPALPAYQVDEPGDPIYAVFKPLYGIDADTVYLSPGPVYHAAPLRFGGMVHRSGGTVVLMERFDAENALAAIEQYRATHSQWVPTMFVRLLKLPEAVRWKYDLSSLRVAIHAAAPCPVEVKQQMIDWWGPILQEYYSSTEANGITLISSEQWLERPGSVGRAALGTIHICADDGTELPPGQVGLVYFERDAMPFAYHHDADKTSAAQHPDHLTWSAIGDVGFVDDDGFLFLTDRQAFMIISGGVNIYPQEAEDVLVLHPAVHDVAVIGIPDPEMGQQVKAVVQLADGVPESTDVAVELMEFARSRMAHFKAPRSVDFIDAMPRTATGKLVKRELTKLYPPPTA